MKKALASIALAAMLTPTVSSADFLNYNYVDGGLAFYPNFGNQDFVGVDANASFSITHNVFVFGGLTYLTDDLDLTAMHIGGAYRVEVARDVDIYGGLTLEYQEIEMTFFHPTLGRVKRTVDDTALGLRGGIRATISNQWEVGSQVRVITGDLDYVGISGYGQYFLNRNVGLIGEVDIYDGEVGVIARLRYNF
jgi:hypothetical protein